jgi:hypothetical protein
LLTGQCWRALRYAETMATRCERTTKHRGELDVPQAKFHYFLQLPAELRIKIYNPLLLQESPILVMQAMWVSILEHDNIAGLVTFCCVSSYFPTWERGKAPCIELFYVNKGVGAEARYQFYFINTFSFWEGTNISAWKEVATRFIDWYVGLSIAFILQPVSSLLRG